MGNYRNHIRENTGITWRNINTILHKYADFLVSCEKCHHFSCQEKGKYYTMQESIQTKRLQSDVVSLDRFTQRHPSKLKPQLDKDTRLMKGLLNG